MHGGEHSEPRWYDKSISLLVTPDGQASTNFEHSPFDGSTIIRMQNDIWHMAAGLDSGKAVPTEAVHLEEEVLDCEAVMSLADRYVFFNQHLNLPRFTSEDEVSTARPLGSISQSLSLVQPFCRP